MSVVVAFSDSGRTWLRLGWDIYICNSWGEFNLASGGQAREWWYRDTPFIRVSDSVQTRLTVIFSGKLAASMFYQETLIHSRFSLGPDPSDCHFFR